MDICRAHCERLKVWSGYSVNCEQEEMGVRVEYNAPGLKIWTDPVLICVKTRKEIAFRGTTAYAKISYNLGHLVRLRDQHILSHRQCHSSVDAWILHHFLVENPWDNAVLLLAGHEEECLFWTHQYHHQPLSWKSDLADNTALKCSYLSLNIPYFSAHRKPSQSAFSKWYKNLFCWWFT